MRCWGLGLKKEGAPRVRKTHRISLRSYKKPLNQTDRRLTSVGGKGEKQVQQQEGLHKGNVLSVFISLLLSSVCFLCHLMLYSGFGVIHVGNSSSCGVIIIVKVIGKSAAQSQFHLSSC